MAAGKKTAKTTTETSSETDDFSDELIASLNKEFGARVAYNLSTDKSPTHVKRWISSGSFLLDYAVSNRKDGGFPEGRIIEIFGEPSTGKSHIALEVAKTVQKMGGIVVYIDTENATPVDKLSEMGLDVSKRFVYCDPHMTEDVFKIAESTILKASKIQKKNVPILVVWDSVAATSPKAELEGEYDDNTVGLQARVISKGMRKITGVIGQHNVTFMCLNQTRSKIGIMFGDPTTTPGGAAIPFHASVRLKLTGGSPIKKGDTVIGITTNVRVIKNKVAPPHKKISFDIIFGAGIDEGASLFDLLRKETEKNPMLIENKLMSIEGTSGWKAFRIADNDTGEVLYEKKFQKSQFAEMLHDDTNGPMLQKMIDKLLTTTVSKDEEVIADEQDNETK